MEGGWREVEGCVPCHLMVADDETCWIRRLGFGSTRSTAGSYLAQGKLLEGPAVAGAGRVEVVGVGSLRWWWMPRPTQKRKNRERERSRSRERGKKKRGELG